MEGASERVKKLLFMIQMKHKQLFEDWIRDVEQNHKELPIPGAKRKFLMMENNIYQGVILYYLN